MFYFPCPLKRKFGYIGHTQNKMAGGLETLELSAGDEFEILIIFKQKFSLFLHLFRQPTCYFFK